ncbi:MAG: PIN domain-containing protein [Rhizobiales bacterium]|nr:PIN domain-containing protein [Hyphomicrobiales bacterium]
MTVRVFVDTNVLIYSRDANDPQKATLSAEWLRRLRPDGLILSPQVLNEAYAVGLWKYKDVGTAALAGWIRDLQRYCTAPLNVETVGLALELHEETKLSWWDCLIVASALMAGCRYLLSEDMQHDRIIRTLRLINPFAIGPSAVIDQN